MMRSMLLSVAIVAIASGASAQQGVQPPTLQLHYQEPIPVNGDMTAARAKIMAQIESDCATAAKALGRQCMVNNVNFNDWRMQHPAAGAFTLNATAQVSLTEAPKLEAPSK